MGSITRRTTRELQDISLRDALVGAAVNGVARHSLERLVASRPNATLLDARLVGGIGPATIDKLVRACSASLPAEEDDADWRLP